MKPNAKKYKRDNTIIKRKYMYVTVICSLLSFCLYSLIYQYFINRLPILKKQNIYSKIILNNKMFPCWV